MYPKITRAYKDHKSIISIIIWQTYTHINQKKWRKKLEKICVEICWGGEKC